MLAFDPIKAMSCDFLRVSQYFAIPPKLYKKSQARDRLGRAGDRQEKSNIRIRNYINYKLEEEQLSQESYHS